MPTFVGMTGLAAFVCQSLERPVLHTAVHSRLLDGSLCDTAMAAGDIL
jgi:hypothetical protein